MTLPFLLSAGTGFWDKFQDAINILTGPAYYVTLATIVFVLMIVLGSVITGWHYLIDAYAGLLLGFASYWPVARAFRIAEWARLRRALTR